MRILNSSHCVHIRLETCILVKVTSKSDANCRYTKQKDVVDKVHSRVRVRQGGREQGQDVVHMRFGPRCSQVGEDMMCHYSLKEEMVADTSRTLNGSQPFCESKLFD